MNTFCVIPWIHLATHPHGGTCLCCVTDFKDGAGMSKDGEDYYNLNKNTITEHMNSEVFKNTRLDMLKGKISFPCKRCYTEEKKGITSKRAIENKNYSNFTIGDAKKITNIDGSIDPKLEFVELRLGNVCNVKCVTCNPASSSKWASDYKILSNKLNYITDYSCLPKSTWHDKKEFWDDLFDKTQNVKTFYINGGEPTLVKAHWNFIKKLIDTNRTNITLWYSINMTTVPPYAFDLWKKFDKVQISCSIDDLTDRNYYIRYPTKWIDVENNLNKLLQHKWLDVSVNQTVSLYNYWYLPEFWNYMNDKNIFVHHNYVYDPDFLSPLALPLEFREECHKKFKDCNWEIWRTNNLLNTFSNPSNADLTLKAKKYINLLDTIRKTNFKTSFQEVTL